MTRLPHRNTLNILVFQKSIQYSFNKHLLTTSYVPHREQSIESYTVVDSRTQYVVPMTQTSIVHIIFLLNDSFIEI